jgi:hypothetical protein
MMKTSLGNYGRGGIEFCAKLGKNGNETLEMLWQAYGVETVNHAAVFQWWRHFKDGNTRVIDKARSGRPSNAVTDVSIAKAAEPLENYRRSLREPSASLNISFEHKRRETPFAWNHEAEKTGFAQETMVFAPG